MKKRFWLSEILYPRHCPFCDRLLTKREPFLCHACARQLKWIRGPVCMRCGRPLENGEIEYCENCRKTEHLFTKGYAPFVYTGMIQRSLMRFKYGGRAEYAVFYAEAIAKKLAATEPVWMPELITAVPIHAKRYRVRGYNQAELIAESLAEKLKVRTSGTALWRRRNTKPQKGLAPKDRRKNLSEAFGVEGGFVFPKRVLLIDDIYTTGATIDALAAVVLAHGATEVRFACVAIAAGRS